MSQDDEFADAKLVGPVKSANPAEAEIINHFMADLGTLEEKPEELAAELYEIRSRLKADKEREEKILFFFKSKRDRGCYPVGEYIMEVKEERGRTTVDWKQYILDEVGADGVADAEKKYSKTGAPIVKVSIKKPQS